MDVMKDFKVGRSPRSIVLVGPDCNHRCPCEREVAGVRLQTKEKEHNLGGRDQNHPQEKEMQKGKMVV